MTRSEFIMRYIIERGGNPSLDEERRIAWLGELYDKIIRSCDMPAETLLEMAKRPIADCGFGKWVREACAKNYLLYVGDLLRYSRRELLGMQGFGPRCVDELEGYLTAHGLQLKNKVV